MAHYTVELPNVASEVFEAEVVIADFVEGSYFSVGGSGAFIWQGLRGGRDAAEISQWLAEHYGLPQAELAPVVDGFVGQLRDAGLIREIDPSGVVPRDLPVLNGGTFSEASLERYDDLRDLLLLDPVHDVAEAGWPHLPTEKA